MIMDFAFSSHTVIIIKVKLLLQPATRWWWYENEARKKGVTPLLWMTSRPDSSWLSVLSRLGPISAHTLLPLKIMWLWFPRMPFGNNNNTTWWERATAFFAWCGTVWIICTPKWWLLPDQARKAKVKGDFGSFGKSAFFLRPGPSGFRLLNMFASHARGFWCPYTYVSMWVIVNLHFYSVLQMRKARLRHRSHNKKEPIINLLVHRIVSEGHGY